MTFTVTPLQMILRTVALLVSLALSGYGLMMGVGIAIAAAHQALTGAEPIHPVAATWAAVMGFAWLAWFVMAVAWVVGKRLHRFWPIAGLAAGCISIITTIGFGLLFTFPAIVMAIILTAFHLERPGAHA